MRALAFRRTWAAAFALTQVFVTPAIGGSTALAADPTSTSSLRDGDRILFYGDSITEQGHYSNAIEAWARSQRPQAKFTFVNSGWSGDRAWGGEGGDIDERLRRDVIPNRPTVVAVMLGMNDAYYTGYDAKTAQQFSQFLEHIVDVLQKELPDARITLIGASPYDKVSAAPRPDWEAQIKGGYNSVVRRYSEAAAEVAQARGLTFVDMNEPLVRVLEEVSKKDAKLGSSIIPDRIHPGPQAGWVMAAQLARAWDLAPKNSTVELDAHEPARVVSADNAVVIELAGGGRLRWTQRDAALPLPIDLADPLTKLLVDCSPDLQSTARRTLRIDNLPSTSARLLIDGQDMGVYTRAEWAIGVDLSKLPTPMARQAAEGARLVQIRNMLSFVRWRRLELADQGENRDSLKAPIEEASDIERRLDALATELMQPRPHAYEVIWSDEGVPAASSEAPR